MKKLVRRAGMMVLLGLGGVSAASSAATALQCVPYARMVSGVAIYGDALTWWNQAQDRYKRGHVPKKGAVLAFRPSGPMQLGHVAVVSRIIDDRQVLVRHANWSAPGAIEEDVLAIDVSTDGDWSEVRVWHSPTGQMGARTNPTYGFIYPDKSRLHPFVPDGRLGTSIRMASTSMTVAPSQTMPVRMAGLTAQPTRAERRTMARQSFKAARIDYDPSVIRYADNSLAHRSLGDIIDDVKHGAPTG